MVQHKQAFTLIELLVVVLIIGILAAVAVPQYQTAVDKTLYSTMMAAVQSVKQQQEIFYLANGYYAKTWEELGADVPGECSLKTNTYQCGTFRLAFGKDSYVYGSLLKGVHNSYLAYYNHRGDRINCYAYPEDGMRGERLCLTWAKFTENGCNNDCKVYRIK